MELEEHDIQAIRFFDSGGGLLTSTINPEVTCHLPEGALTLGKKNFCRVSVQVINIDNALVQELMGQGSAISPVVVLEPVRRRFHQHLTLTIPVPGADSRKFNPGSVRFLFSITGTGENANWEDLTAMFAESISNMKDGRISINLTVTGRCVVVSCDNSIMDIPATMSELFRSFLNGRLFCMSEPASEAAFINSARTGDLNTLITCLMLNKVPIDYRNGDGETALHLAANGGYREVVRELLARGADYSVLTGRGNAAIHLASYCGHTEVVRSILNHGCPVDLPSKAGFPPLYPAILEMHCDIVELLLLQNAKVNWVTEDGLSLLLVGLCSVYDRDKTMAMMTLLLQHVDLSHFPLSPQMKERGFHCHSAALLHLVGSRQASKDLVAALRKKLANLSNAVLQTDMDSIESTTSPEVKDFLSAAVNGNAENLKSYISSSVFLNCSTERLVGAIHCACYHGNQCILTKLIDSGCDINKQTEGGFTGLHLAAKEGHKNIANCLLRAGADSNMSNQHGLTAEDIAVESGHDEVARLIRERRIPAQLAESGKASFHRKTRSDPIVIDHAPKTKAENKQSCQLS